MKSIEFVTLASVFNRNQSENEQIIRNAIESVVQKIGVYPLIEGSLQREPLKAAA